LRGVSNSFIRNLGKPSPLTLTGRPYVPNLRLFRPVCTLRAQALDWCLYDRCSLLCDLEARRMRTEHCHAGGS